MGWLRDFWLTSSVLRYLCVYVHLHRRMQNLSRSDDERHRLPLKNRPNKTLQNVRLTEWFYLSPLNLCQETEYENTLQTLPLAKSPVHLPNEHWLTFFTLHQTRIIIRVLKFCDTNVKSRVSRLHLNPIGGNHWRRMCWGQLVASEPLLNRSWDEQVGKWRRDH